MLALMHSVQSNSGPFDPILPLAFVGLEVTYTGSCCTLRGGVSTASNHRLSPDGLGESAPSLSRTWDTTVTAVRPCRERGGGGGRAMDDAWTCLPEKWMTRP